MFCDLEAVSAFEIIGVVMIVPAVDWIAITGSAARYSDFDYRYWPPGKARILSVLLVAVTVGIAAICARADDPPSWSLIPAFVALVIWGLVGCLDIIAQRKTGYRITPSYGERE